MVASSQAPRGRGGGRAGTTRDARRRLAVLLESDPNRSNPPDRTGPAARGYRSAALRILKSDCSPGRRYALRVSGSFRSRLEMRLSAYRGTGPFPTRVFYGWPGEIGRASCRDRVGTYV